MGDPRHHPTADTQRWCLELPWAGTRPLDAFERRTIYRHARAARRRAWWISAGMIPAVAAGLTGLMLQGPPTWHHIAGYALAVSIVSIGVLVPCLALLARERFRAASRALQDLESGSSERYEGALGPIDRLGGATRSLLERGLFEPDPRRPQRVEVSPHGRLVLRVNGRPTERLLRAPAVELARPRPHGYATALPAGLVQVENDTRLQLLRRSLTPAEMSELRERGLGFRRRFWWTTLLAAGPSAALAIWLTHLLALTRALQAGAGVLGIVVVVVVSYFVWLRLVRRVEADRTLRWVITMRDEAGGESQIEVLPASGLIWTERDKPAGWRLSAR